jgi:outer membrane protein TolC
MVAMRIFRYLLSSSSLVVLLSACAVQPEPLTEADMRAQAVSDKAEMYSAEAPVTKPLSLSESIARALTYNLDRRTKVMEEALAVGQKNLDRWDLLPKLAANAGYTSRSEANATRSRDAITNATSTSNPTYSTDRDNVTADLGLTWNILDLGVSYMSAKQVADKAMIATERRRKTVHNLIQEVRFAYWRTAAAQVLEKEVTETVSMAEQALVDARAVERESLKSPAEILRFQKNLLENLRQLETVSHELSTARVELAALVNLPPGSDLSVEIPDASAMIVAPFELTPERMEELAFINNPDLREQVYLSRIAVDETKKTILKMLPGINLNLNNKWDSNSFLVDHQWYEMGAKITWNLLNILSAPDQMEQAEASEKVANAKRVALRMAVLAQVHVAYRQYQNAGKQFLRADELYLVEQRLAQFSRIRADNDAQSIMERIANHTSAIAAQLRRYQSYAQMESAYGKMQATLGQDLLPDAVASRDLDVLTTAVSERLALWRKGYAPEPAAIADEPAPAPVMAAELASAVASEAKAVPTPLGVAVPSLNPEPLPAVTLIKSPAKPKMARKAAPSKPQAKIAVITPPVSPQPVAVETAADTVATPIIEENLRPARPVIEWVRPGLSDAKLAEIAEKAAKQSMVKHSSPRDTPQALRYTLPSGPQDDTSVIMASSAE